jgi:hypothetical protein
MGKYEEITKARKILDPDDFATPKEINREI